MMKYDGYIIKTKPDYKSAIRRGKAVDEISCEVYDENDKEFEHCLGDFNMMIGFEFQDSTVKDIESGIKKMIDNDWAYYQLEKKGVGFKRTEELFYRLINHMRVTLGDDETKSILQKEIDMTEAEIQDALSDSDMEHEETNVSQGMDLT